MTEPLSLIVTTARGTEGVLAKELAELPVAVTGVESSAVRVETDLAGAYDVCLWSRVASRVLLVLSEFEASDGDALYAAAYDVPWTDHFAPDQTFAVGGSHSGPPMLPTHFASLKVKDAVADWFRARFGKRPNVDVRSPSIRIHVHLGSSSGVLALDLAGEALHRRGYRPPDGAAPLKENLAAAVLLLAGFDELVERDVPFVDPMCGTGTLVVEAAMMRLRMAPGLGRSRWGFEAWLAHEPSVFRTRVDHARAARRQQADVAVYGFDASAAALDVARRSCARAGVAEAVRLAVRPLADQEAPPGPAGAPRGLLVVNPPYGERLGDANELMPLYEQIGDVLRRRYLGWRACVLSGNAKLSRHIGLRASRRHVLYNGPIECRLLEYAIAEAPAGGSRPGWRRTSPEAEMFENRLRKNVRSIGAEAKRRGVTCYRLYDADVPEFNVAIDVYEDALHVQEYERPRSVDPAVAETHVRDVLQIAPAVLGVRADHVFFKVRRRQSRGAQYGKAGELGGMREVREGACRFLVNLTDYLDTGLFLDHRTLRERIATAARDKSLLNLFAYTCTASVAAAVQGCRASTSVDLSSVYLEWGERNFANNRVPRDRHRTVRADCMQWLMRREGTFDVVFVAPPIFSRSKRVDRTFDVQRDHIALLEAVSRVLRPGGLVFFSTPLRTFTLNRPGLRSYSDVRDITPQTTPFDFRRKEPHRTFELVRR